MKDLLEAGVHFGHQTKRWNPKMKPFIFGERSGIYILDLGKTVKHYREAEDFVRQLAAEGKTIMFVGTKRQAQDVVAEEASRCGMFYVNERWLGGLLANFTTIQRSLTRLRDLEAMATDGRYDTLSKKEIARNEKERKKLAKNLDGIRGMTRLPDAVFIYLAYAQPDNLAIISACVAVEQFGYGFGFTAYMLYMIYIARGQHQTAHYAICTGFMALGMMFPGMWSGWLQEIIGYQHFFVWVILATVPSFLVVFLIPLDREFGKKA